MVVKEIIPVAQPPPLPVKVVTQHEVIRQPGPVREFKHEHKTEPKPVPPPVRAQAPPPPPPVKEGICKKWWWCLLPLLLCCLPLLLLCCPKKKPPPEVIPPPYKAPIDLDPEKAPVRAVNMKEEALVDEDITRKMATVQRTVVQSVQIPVEEYEELYGAQAAAEYRGEEKLVDA